MTKNLLFIILFLESFCLTMELPKVSTTSLMFSSVNTTPLAKLGITPEQVKNLKDNAANEEIIRKIYHSIGHQENDTVKELLAAGFDPNFNSKKFGIPLMCAVSANSYKIATFLLNAGADPNMPDGPEHPAILRRTPLMEAVSRHNLPILIWMLNAKGDPHKIIDGRTAFGLAQGYHQILSLFDIFANQNSQ